MDVEQAGQAVFRRDQVAFLSYYKQLHNTLYLVNISAFGNSCAIYGEIYVLNANGTLSEMLKERPRFKYSLGSICV